MQRSSKISHLFNSFLLSFFIPRAVSIQNCYYPDGLAALGHVPCSKNGDGTCCEDGDVCTSNGLCLRSNTSSDLGSQITRESCTDQSWNSPGCSSFCRRESANTTGFLLTCPGLGSCCYNGQIGAGGCCNKAIGIFDLGPYTNITTIGVPAPPSTATLQIIPLSFSATSSISLQPSTTASKSSNLIALPQHDLSPGAKAGIGVVFALLIIIIAVLGLFLYRRKRKHSSSSHLTKSELAELTTSERAQELSQTAAKPLAELRA